MGYYCYILYSPSLDKYYTGCTSNTVEGRLQQHLEGYYGGKKYTHIAKDWEIYLEIPCETYRQAMMLEKHIKRMKSREYIRNMKKYPEIIVKLLLRYKDKA